MLAYLRFSALGLMMSLGGWATAQNAPMNPSALIGPSQQLRQEQRIGAMPNPSSSSTAPAKTLSPNTRKTPAPIKTNHEESYTFTVDPQTGQRWINVQDALDQEPNLAPRRISPVQALIAERVERTERKGHATPAFPAFQPQSVLSALAVLPLAIRELYPMGAPWALSAKTVAGFSFSPSGRYAGVSTGWQTTQVREVDHGELVNPQNELAKISADERVWMNYFDRVGLPMRTTAINAANRARSVLPERVVGGGGVVNAPSPTATTTPTAVDSMPPARLLSVYTPPKRDGNGRDSLPWVYALAFYPQGDRMVSGGSDGVLRVWHVAENRIIGEPIPAHQGWVYSIAIDNAGENLASGGNDGMIRLFSAQTGAEKIPPINVGGEIYALRFTPNGERLFAACSDGNIRVFQVSNGRLLGGLSGHRQSVFALSMSANGEILASGGEDGTIRLWSVKHGAPIAQVNAQGGTVYGLAFSPDGANLASVGTDSQLKLWSTPSAAPLSAEPKILYTENSPLLSVAFGPDGQWVAAGSFNQKLWVWNVQEGKPTADSPINAHQGWVNAVLFYPAGSWFASVSADGSVRAWHTNPPLTPVRLESLKNPLSSPSLNPAPAPTMNAWQRPQPLMAQNPRTFDWARVEGGVIRQFANASTVQNAPSIVLPNNAEGLALNYSRDGAVLLVADSTGRVQGYWAKTGTLISQGLIGPGASALALSADERFLVVGYEDGAINLFARTAQSEETPATANRPARASRALRLKASPPDEWVSVPTWKTEPHRGAVSALVMLDDVLISASADQTLRQWSLRDGRPLSDPVGGHFTALSALAAHPATHRAATGGSDGSVQIWEFR